MKNKSLSVIVVSYNSEQFIEKCIASVLKYLPDNSELIVLDNNSVDKTVDISKKFLPKIKLISIDKNLGFAKGNNKAANEALGDYLFFLNPDTWISKPIMEELIEFYEAEDAGIVAPKLIMPNGHTQSSVKNLPTVWGAFKEFILGVQNSYGEFVPKTEKPIAVQVVYGAALLISKKLFDQIGGFDEKYFLYYEDVDLCRKVLNKDKKIYYYPAAAVNHIVGGTKSSQDKYRLNFKSAILYHGYFKFLILQIIFRLRTLLK
ncbi:glycosyltransferase family 2 protein [Candidatus Daviesbacteria bacterium]|nr:glycosyltransferase family 2 protein [Candidatus Daviesbacteria bacterium]